MSKTSLPPRLQHESIWDAFEPLIFGRTGHGAGTLKETPRAKMPDMLDKDGRPLGPSSVLVPGTRLRVDTHDGRGFRPYVIPGKPSFPSDKKEIKAFFTTAELDALRAAGIEPWDEKARTVLTAERSAEIHATFGLWQKL